MNIDNLFKDLLKLFLANQIIHFQFNRIFRSLSLNTAEILRKNFVKEESSECGLYNTGNGLSIRESLYHTHMDSCMNIKFAVLVSKDCFVYIFKVLSGTLYIRSFLGQIVNTENHILRRNRYGCTVGRLKQVVRGQKQESALCLCFHAEGKVNSHLVSVEVCIECGTYKRMKLNCLTFDKNRLECLNTESVKCRSTV